MPELDRPAGHDRLGRTLFATGLPRVRIKDDPRGGCESAKVTPIGCQGGWAHIPRGDYLLWPVGKIEKLIKVLEGMK